MIGNVSGLLAALQSGEAGAATQRRAAAYIEELEKSRGETMSDVILRATEELLRETTRQRDKYINELRRAIDRIILLEDENARLTEGEVLSDCETQRLTEDVRSLRATTEDREFTVEKLEAENERLRKALDIIANHPQEYKDKNSSYGLGYAFYIVQNIARAELARESVGSDAATPGCGEE
jgi:predicted RNase H-like nuclease (RuvC/YqgF family)